MVAGNVASIQYASQNGNIGTENFVYANGHNTEIKLNNTTSIWKLTEENALGQPTKATTGTMARTYGYTAFGMPTGRTAGSIQNFTYNFDVQKGNLLSRKDNKRGKTETFGYDNLNRLSSIGTQQIGYAANGNITQMPGVGTLAYGNTDKPYQVTMLTPTGTAVPVREQSVTYTSFQRPNTLTENGITASFAYNAGGDRVKMHVAQGATALLTRYYIGKQYELDAQTNTERLYLGGDAYSAPAVFVKENGSSWKIYYICRDYLGSITHIANSDGSLKQELSYDAWGRLRNPTTQVAYTPGTEPGLFLGRGYTGHEHLPWFGLINMNARLYDPLLGRFLSPDPYVQAPNFTQNFNRYSYCLNNPLVYVDENGEWIQYLIGAVVGGVINWVSNGCQFTWEGLSYFGAGAVAGLITVASPGSFKYVSAGLGTTNSVLKQGFQSDWKDINFGSALLDGVISGATAAAGAKIAPGMDKIFNKIGVNDIKSPLLREVSKGVLSNAPIGGLISGFQELGDDDPNTTFGSGFWKGFKSGIATGGISGIGNAFLFSTTKKVDFWSGKDLNPNSNPYNGKIVTNPAGNKVTIDIPPDYVMRQADNGNGVVYQAPGATGNANMIRIMGPTNYAPNGYSVFYNSYGQPFNPNTGETLGRALWHFKF